MWRTSLAEATGQRDLTPTLAILTPMRDQPSREYQYALTHNVEIPFVHLTEVGKTVEVARNLLVERVRELKPRPEFVAWIDDDAYWLPGTIPKLLDALTHRVPEETRAMSMVLPWFGIRLTGDYVDAYRSEKLKGNLALMYGRDVPLPCLWPISMTSTHFLVHRTAALDWLGSAPFKIYPDLDWAEDEAFCMRWRSAGGSIYLVGDVGVYHVQVKTGLAYLPGAPGPFRVLDDGTPEPALDDPVIETRAYFGPACDKYQTERSTIQRITLNVVNELCS